jgi:predicted nucleotidyltransferase
MRKEGCSAVFLFGSLTTGLFKPDSDIDLAIQGCPPRKFFPLLARLLEELDYPVDLLDLDEDDILARHLLAQKEMILL